jgi:hypothetical protein
MGEAVAKRRVFLHIPKPPKEEAIMKKSFSSCLALLVFMAAFAHPAAALAQNVENTAPLCQDGIDNDGDWKVDCQDEDCAALSFCASSSAPAAGGASAAGTSAAAPAPAASSARISGGGEGRKWGAGLFLSLIAFSRTKANVESAYGSSETKYKMRFTAGLALFGEYFVHPYVAVGGEFHVIFPKGTEISGDGGDHWADCTECAQSYGFELLFRVKAPIKVHRLIGVYPLVTFGFADIVACQEHAEHDNYAGLGWGLGAGIEFYPIKLITPFFDIRYMGAAGWNTDKDSGVDKDQIIYNSLTFNLGVRFL